MSMTEGTSGPVARPDAPRMPPHPLDAEWYLNIEGETFGPYTGHRIKQMSAEGRVTGSTDVVRSGGDSWTTAIKDAVLGPLFAPVTVSPATAAIGGSISAEKGATIVQVHNVVNPSASLLAFDDGLAAPKSAGLAAFLSFIFVGLGQIYNGQVGKGILMFFGCVLMWLILLGWIMTIWSCIDAYQTAKAMNIRYLRRIQAGAPV